MACHSIFVNNFIEELIRTRGSRREDLDAEFREAALRAARRRFGDATPIDVTFSSLGQTEFWQELEAVATVEDERRQIAMSDLKRACPDLEVAEGDFLRLPIHYGGGNPPVKYGEELGPLAPLPLHDDELWDRLNEELNALVQRYFPPPPHKPGSMGEVLASGGGWLKGLSASAAGVTLTVERTYFDVLTLDPFRGWVDYGFVLTLEQADRPAATYQPKKGDNDCNVLNWTPLASSEAARELFLAQLAALAGEIAERGPGGLSEYTACAHLISAALRPPAPGSLMEWLPAALAPLEDYSKTVELEDGTVTFKAFGVYAPDIGMSHESGKGAIRLTAEVGGRPLAAGGVPSAKSAPAVAVLVDGQYVVEAGDYPGDVIGLGYVTPEAAEKPGPRTDEERRDIDRIVATFRDWLDAHLEHHARISGLEAYRGMNFFYAFPGYFPLVDLIESRLDLGPAGPPPVPPFDEDALERAGRTLAAVQGADRVTLLRQLAAGARPAAAPEEEARKKAALESAGWKVKLQQVADELQRGGRPEPGSEGDRSTVGVFTAQGWTIRLTDQLDGHPFGLPSISLVPPEGGPAVTVLMVDAWNPQARTVVDGDAFAFRRFVTWLRQGIIRGGHDSTVTFRVDDEEEVDEDEESEESGAGEYELSVSDWLLFELPDFGDRFLVDWRAQWDIVNAVGKTEDMGGIYGFTGEYRDRLRTRDIPTWRRFLREVIDPRFDATWGNRMVTAA